MGKAKDGSECYTRQGNSGTYVTCEGTQKGGKSSGSSASKSKAKPQTGKARRTGGPPGQTGFARRTGGPPGQKPKAKPKAQAVKVVKGTRKSIDLEATDKSKPKAKAKAKPASAGTKPKAVAKGKQGYPFQQKDANDEQKTVLDKFNKMMGITRAPKKGEYMVLGDGNFQDGYKINYIKDDKALLKAVGYDSKKYEPLSKAQLTRIKKFTGDTNTILELAEDRGGISSTAYSGKVGIQFKRFMPLLRGPLDEDGTRPYPGTYPDGGARAFTSGGKPVAPQLVFKRIKK